MRICVFTSILLGCCAIAGCKSDSRKAETALTPSSQGERASTTSSDLRKDERPILVCFGDSLTAGYGTEAGQSYPEYLQTLLDAGRYKYRVVNSGVSGNTSKDGLDRIERLMARKPELVVLEFGGNDGLRGLPLEQTQANLDAILKQLQSAGIKIALAGITLPPDYGPDYIHRFTMMYAALAKKFNVPLLPFLLQGVYGVPGGMQADATHATAKGNQQVARNVAKLIEPMLTR